MRTGLKIPLQQLTASLVGRVAHWCRWHRERHHIDPRSTLTRNCDISPISALARGRHCLGGMVTTGVSLRHGIIGAAGAVTYETSARSVELQAGRHPLSQGFVRCGPVWALHVASHCYHVCGEGYPMLRATLRIAFQPLDVGAWGVQICSHAHRCGSFGMPCYESHRGTRLRQQTLLGFRNYLDCLRPVYHGTALNVPVHLRLSQTHVNANVDMYSVMHGPSTGLQCAHD